MLTLEHNTTTQVQQKPLISAREIAILNQKWRVLNNLSDVTGEQMGACYMVWDYQKRIHIWIVESATDPGVDYHPEWSPEMGYRCQCGSGQVGFVNVSHPSHVCWHVRAMEACRLEMEEALHSTTQAPIIPIRPRDHRLEIAGHIATDAEYDRIMNARPAYVSPSAPGRSAHAFRLLK